MNSKHSSIWFRTIIYLGSAFGAFFVVGLALLWFVGSERSATNVRLADTERLAARQSEWVAAARSARDRGPAALNAFLDESAAAAGERGKLVTTIRDLEREPKTAKNQADIRTGLAKATEQLNADYAEYDPFTTEIQNARKRIIFAFLVIFGALTAVVLILFRMIVRPLESIVQNAQRVSQGELDIEFRLESNDEMGQLSRVMDSLTTNFRELLTLMQSSVRTGLQLTDELKGAEPDGKAKLADVFHKMREITEYFTGSEGRSGDAK